MVRKTITILRLVAQNSSLSFSNINVYVPFAASKVTVRSISLSDDCKGVTYEVRSNIVPDQSLGIIVDELGSSNPGLEIDLGGQTIRGVYNLTLYNAANTIPTAIAAAGAFIGIVLEFSGEEELRGKLPPR